jgi:hypothetical protein
LLVGDPAQPLDGEVVFFQSAQVIPTIHVSGLQRRAQPTHALENV